MTQELFLEDSYLRECDAVVDKVKDLKYVVLDKSIFYPRGGGQSCDTGEIVKDGNHFNVVYVGRFSSEISHEVDKSGLEIGDKVRCLLNWERRYKLMRSHTASHVFLSLLCSGTGALVTGNQIEEDQIRFDFNLETFDRQIAQKYIDETNKLLSQDIPVKSYYMRRDKVLNTPGFVKMASALPPNIPLLRIVEIAGIDKQPDGGTHVKNLLEVGKINLIKTDNKGKNNRRIYFRLNEQ